MVPGDAVERTRPNPQPGTDVDVARLAENRGRNPSASAGLPIERAAWAASRGGPNRMSKTSADMPDGVADAHTVATAIMDDYHREKAVRNWIARRDATRTNAAAVERLALASSEAQQRAALLERARQGDPDAGQELWKRYKLKLTLGDAGG